MVVAGIGERARACRALVPAAAALSFRRAASGAEVVTVSAPEEGHGSRPRGDGHLFTPRALIVAQMLGAFSVEDVRAEPARAAAHYRAALQLARELMPPTAIEA